LNNISFWEKICSQMTRKIFEIFTEIIQNKQKKIIITVGKKKSILN